MKKFIAILLVLCMTISPAVIFAQEDDTCVFELKALNILRDSDGYELEKPVTRAESAIYIARLLGYDNLKATDSSLPFTDVSADNPAYDAIAMLKDLGFVNGATETTFEPDTNIDKYMAAAMLVRALGYEMVASGFGGYPEKYLIMGGRLKIFDGVSNGDTFTLRDFAQMMYNALDVGMLEPSSYPAENYQVSKENTLRKFIENRKDDLSFSTGFMSANYELYTMSLVNNLKPDEVYIDNTVYKVGSTDAANYVGMKVEFYYSDKTGGKTITEIRRSPDVNYADIALEDVNKINGNTLYYQSSDTKESRLSLSETAAYIKNYEPVVSNIQDVLLSGDGIARFIDNDNDKDYDVVIIEQYKSLPVEKVTTSESSFSIIFKGGYLYNNMQSVAVDYLNDDVYYTIRNNEGEAIKPEDIKTGDIAGIVANSDSTRIKIYISDKKITGKVSGLSDDEIEIGGDWYKTEKDVDFKDFLGKNTTVYFSYRDRAAYAKLAEDDANNNYAVVIKLGSSRNSFDMPKIMLGRAGNLKGETEESTDAVDADSKEEIPQLAVRNSEVLKLDFAKKVNIDGVRYNDNDDILRVVRPGSAVKYYLDEEGKVKKLETLNPVCDATTVYYDAYENTFYGSGGFGVSVDETLGVCYPTNPDTVPIESDLDYLGKVKLNHQQRYQVLGYETDDESKCVKLILVMESLKYGTVSGVKTNSPVGIAADVSHVLDEDRNEGIKLVIEGADGSHEYIITEDSPSYDVIEGISEGDFITYALDTENLPGAYQRFCNLDELSDPFIRNESGQYETYYGRVDSMEYKYVSEEANIGKWVDKMSVSDGNGGNAKYYELRVTAPPDILIYYKANGTVSKASSYDIISGEDVVVYATSGKVRAVVIVK